MFWVLLSIISLILTILFDISEWRDTRRYEGFSVLGLFIFLLIIALLIPKGIKVYPNLRSLKIRVESIKSEIESVRNAYYKNNNGGLIVGNIENFQQSTNLSKYIERYAELKAEYNSKLKYYQTIKRLPIYFWFSYSAFVPDKIFELEYIK